MDDKTSKAVGIFGTVTMLLASGGFALLGDMLMALIFFGLAMLALKAAFTSGSPIDKDR